MDMGLFIDMSCTNPMEKSVGSERIEEFDFSASMGAISGTEMVLTLNFK